MQRPIKITAPAGKRMIEARRRDDLRPASRHQAKCRHHQARRPGVQDDVPRKRRRNADTTETAGNLHFEIGEAPQEHVVLDGRAVRVAPRLLAGRVGGADEPEVRLVSLGREAPGQPAHAPRGAADVGVGVGTFE